MDVQRQPTTYYTLIQVTVSILKYAVTDLGGWLGGAVAPPFCHLKKCKRMN